MADENEDYPLVTVDWLDAWFDFDLRDVDDIWEDYYVATVGYLINESDLVISLAQEILPNDNGFRSVTHIPKGLIKPTGLKRLAGPELEESLIRFTPSVMRPTELGDVHDAVIWPDSNEPGIAQPA